MLINPFPIQFPMHGSLGTTRVSTLPSGATIGAKSVVNYNTKSQPFHRMNERIKYLDQNFKAQPTPTQTAWNTSATTNYTTVGVCGCEGTCGTGQKLYRVTNYFRGLIGLADTNIPPAFWAPTLSGLPAEVTFYNVTIPPLVYVRSLWASVNQWCVYNCLLGLGNPVLFATNTNYNAGDPVYTALAGMQASGTVTACVFGPEGQPGGTCPCPIGSVP